MSPMMRLIAMSSSVMLLNSAEAEAQQRLGWAWQFDGLAVYQGNAGLSGGGEFSAERAFLRTGALYRFDSGASAGLFLSYGQFSYDFSLAGNQPWDRIRDVRITAPVRFSVGESASVFISPQVRWDYEDGASSSDGRTYGVFAGIIWQVNPNLRIGPAFGAFSELGTDGTEVFPALLVDWDIAPRWNLSTGTGLGATQGPGVILSYQHTETLSFSLGARSERVRFRLDNTGLAPGGVGEDQSIPVALSVDYAPNPGVRVSAFVGAEFDGRLTLDSSTGAQISRQDYDTAPIVGFAARIRF
ncbi:hypothetical protein [Falsiruegeria mediterranea]|jgi:hypothetical protein|uniref:Autotransporter domain-containing protein n=1 Tax=Falsiruegeria mediterranea M17 TaxID=1200281 RepID=A0A2R8CEE1_9RHOB|nr:hypothetical protein [Falsiruegeria mediterranea]SPJ30811.1 hypothetical protein TRM7615_04346 [Falsiruegeria mediterranea M17]